MLFAVSAVFQSYNGELNPITAVARFFRKSPVWTLEDDLSVMNLKRAGNVNKKNTNTCFLGDL